MGYNFYTSDTYKKLQSRIALKNWQEGVFKPKTKVQTRLCVNPKCGNLFTTIPSDPKKFCGHSCSAKITNANRKQIKLCLACNFQLKGKWYKYCSLKCQTSYNQSQYIKRWKSGLEDGNRGIATRIISNHLKHYLLEKFKNRCSVCGWNQQHSITGKVPIEVNHIDGNSENNSEENLQLLCPNCHSLTPNFRNLNKGRGRAWRLKTHSV